MPLDERRERIAADLQATNNALGFLIVGNGDRHIHVLGEPGLRAECHRQAADDCPPGTHGIETLGGLHEDRVNGLHFALPAGRQLQAIARFAARPA